MNFLLFAGSLRAGSYNKKLLAVANQILTDSGHATMTADIRSLSLPVYDADIEAVGIPDGVIKLGEMVKKAEAIVVATPEYNNSISSPLKNTVDWVSRLRPVPWEGKPVFLMGTSPGYFGAIRGLTHSRIPFEALGSFLYPQPFAVPKAAEAFGSNGELTDAGTKKRLGEALGNYIRFAESLTQKK